MWQIAHMLRPVLLVSFLVSVALVAACGNHAENCTAVSAWKTDGQAGMYDDGNQNSGFPPNTSAFLFDVTGNQPDGGVEYRSLLIQDFHGTSTYPKTVTFKSTDTFKACDLCVIASDGCVQGDSTACSKLYFQQDGQATVTRADTNVASGTMQATASDLLLREWDFGTDKAVADGGCYTVGSATWNTTWPVTSGFLGATK